MLVLVEIYQCQVAISFAPAYFRAKVRSCAQIKSSRLKHKILNKIPKSNLFRFAHFSTNKIVPANQWMILMGLPQSDLDFGGWGGYRHLLLNSA